MPDDLPLHQGITDGATPQVFGQEKHQPQHHDGFLCLSAHKPPHVPVTFTFPSPLHMHGPSGLCCLELMQWRP
jgi:hypothetical protein